MNAWSWRKGVQALPCDVHHRGETAESFKLSAKKQQEIIQNDIIKFCTDNNSFGSCVAVDQKEPESNKSDLLVNSGHSDKRSKHL